MEQFTQYDFCDNIIYITFTNLCHCPTPQHSTSLFAVRDLFWKEETCCFKAARTQVSAGFSEKPEEQRKERLSQLMDIMCS